MAISDHSTAARETTRRDPDAVPRSGGGAVITWATRLPGGIVDRLVDGGWAVLHTLGAHRWRDGYEVNVERGWSQYRGSRCTICDEPWEGW